MAVAEDDEDKQDDGKAKGVRSFLENNALLRFLLRYTEDQYKPEKHYMRGPGPKAKAKLSGPMVGRSGKDGVSSDE